MQAMGKRIKASLKAIFVPLLLLGAASHAPMAMAQFPGTFTATGDMTTARYWHTATLLADGKVLIAGGRTESGAVAASAKLYDPAVSNGRILIGVVNPTEGPVVEKALQEAGAESVVRRP